MGGSNSGRSHEPQQCGGAHVSNTLSSPNAAATGGIGGLPELHISDDPHPKKSPAPTTTLPTPHTAAPTSHQNTNSPNARVRGSRGYRLSLERTPQQKLG